MRWICLLALLLVLQGCIGEIGEGEPPGRDASQLLDASSVPNPDAGHIDAGTPADAGLFDAGHVDVQRTHEPAGYRRIAELDFSAMLPNSVSSQNCTGPGVLAGCWGHYPYDVGFHTIQNDPTAPASPPGVFQFAYTQGMECGVTGQCRYHEAN